MSMSEARLSSGRLITYEEYIRLELKAEKKYDSLPLEKRPRHKKGERFIKVYCKACDGRVHANKIEGTPGFEKNKKDVTQRKSKELSPIGLAILRNKAKSPWAGHRQDPGFIHHDFSATPDCPSNYSNHIRFATIFRRNDFDKNEIEDNKAAMINPSMQLFFKKAFLAIMTHHSGSITEAKKALPGFEQTQRRLWSMVGLRQHLHFVPLIGAFVADPLKRLMPAGKSEAQPFDIHYEGNGTQRLPIMSGDGKKKQMILPRRLQPRFSRGLQKPLSTVAELMFSKQNTENMAKSFRMDIPALGDIETWEKAFEVYDKRDSASITGDIRRRLLTTDRQLRSHAIDHYTQYNDPIHAEITLLVLAEIYEITRKNAAGRLEKAIGKPPAETLFGRENDVAFQANFKALQNYCAEKSKQVMGLREAIIAGVGKETVRAVRPERPNE